jgi:putative spermidine/putrescine transport system ATP-binding protein
MKVDAQLPQAVRLDHVSVHYRDVPAIQDICLDLPAGEILALLGPSGCGKSTLLRSVAGFVAHSGEVYIGGSPMARIPPHRRKIGMVFQDYALFPHMTVAENVGFGLRMRRLDKALIAKQVSDALHMVGLEGFAERMARQLSGGQQQRVALARALVINPTVLLLDEPLSALDKKLREELRSELKRIQRLTQVTTIFVTHDQDEALGLADRLALLHRGVLLQIGAPEDVYRRPANPFVAEFLGAANSRNAVCREADDLSILLELPNAGFVRAAQQSQTVELGQDVTLFVRPERIRIRPSSDHEEPQSVSATVTARSYLGRHYEFALRLDDGNSWTANTGDETAFASIETGARVYLEIDPENVIVFPGAGRREKG